jgi:6-phosphogluconolactonase (cycloisomerase 2 family)
MHKTKWLAASGSLLAGPASQGAIQATRDGRYLLAVDAGGNQISVLRVTAGRVPMPVGQPVSSGGVVRRRRDTRPGK